MQLLLKNKRDSHKVKQLQKTKGLFGDWSIYDRRKTAGKSITEKRGENQYHNEKGT